MKIKLTGVVVSALLLAGVLVAQEAPEEQSQQPQMMQRMMQQMEARRQQMMGQRNAQLEQLRISMERLDELVVAMESSRGEAKTDAIGKVVAELVAQRQDLLDIVEAQPGMMQQMQMMQMMQQMMGQMQMGEAAAAPEDEQP